MSLLKFISTYCLVIVSDFFSSFLIWLRSLLLSTTACQALYTDILLKVFIKLSFLVEFLEV